MPILHRLAAQAIFLVVSATCALNAAAFSFIPPRFTVTVVELYNEHTGHYFLTANSVELTAIEAGQAGPGWIRTGLVFEGYQLGYTDPDCPSCLHTVHRFYGPGSNSHVFTADPQEAEILRRPGSGWLYEGEAFRIALPDAARQCAGGRVPVARLYNNRWMFNDSNHRYTTRADQRERLRAQGWIDEDVRFCAESAAERPLRSFDFISANPFRVLPSALCEDESVNLGACVAVNNLVPPNHLMPPTQIHNVPRDYLERTGMESSFNYVLPELSSSAALAAAGAFVHGIYQIMGLHVETSRRGPAQFSSINPLYQFRTSVDADGTDRRVFPFATNYPDVQLKIAGTINVKRVSVASPASHAYGHPTLEFIDRRSGRHLYFTVGTYGTIDLGGDFLAPDVATGKVIVGTTLRQGSPYGRNLGIPVLRTPSGFVSENSWGWGGPFDFRIDRHEFQRIVDAARTVDPVLSPDIRDYLLDNFHFNNEVVGDGEIGLNLSWFSLELVHR